MENILKNYIENLKINWQHEPFPHAIIDDFLPQENFLKVVAGLNEVKNFKDIKTHFSSYLEQNKKVYGDEDLNDILKLPINITGGPDIKKIFKNFLNIDYLMSLADVPNYGGYYPFHVMENKGFLGAHVDHGHNKDFSKLHVANSIYYVSKEWKESWGGETLFLNSSGTKIVKKISPLPNRLVIFIHSAKSFHAVNTISCPESIQRMTYYMDYYPHDKNIQQIYKNTKNLKYSYHPTTFVPFFPLGIKNFKFEYLFKKKNFFYLRLFFIYTFLRFLINYKFSKYLISLFRKK